MAEFVLLGELGAYRAPNGRIVRRALYACRCEKRFVTAPVSAPPTCGCGYRDDDHCGLT